MIPYFEIPKLVLKDRGIRKDNPLSNIRFGVRVPNQSTDVAIDFEAYTPITDVFDTVGTFIGQPNLYPSITVERNYNALGKGFVFGNSIAGWREFLTIVALFRNETAIERIRNSLGTLPDIEYFDIPVGDSPNSGWYNSYESFMFVPDNRSSLTEKLILKTPITRPLQYSEYLATPTLNGVDNSGSHPYTPRTLLMAGGHTVLTGDPYLDVATLVSKMKPWKNPFVDRPYLRVGDSYRWRPLSRTVSLDFFQRLYCNYGGRTRDVLNDLKRMGLIKGWIEQ
jgi:hypothetical protein